MFLSCLVLLASLLLLESLLWLHIRNVPVMSMVLLASLLLLKPLLLLASLLPLHVRDVLICPLFLAPFLSNTPVFAGVPAPVAFPRRSFYVSFYSVL
jgi:hypothetical protein